MTQIGTLKGKLEQAHRNEVIHLATGLASVAHASAAQTEETGIAYRGSPVVVGGTRHARLRPGDVAPHVPGTELFSLLAGDSTAHVALHFASAGAPAPPALAAGGIRRILVARDPTPNGTTDAVLPDPDGAIAHRHGLERGGLVLVRPDGYIGYLGEADAPGVESFLQLLN